VADHLIGHFVDQARRSGASWTEIGQHMGVTKQAARKRFIPKDPGGVPEEDAGGGDGFSRFTLRARNAVVVAQEAARDAGSATVTPAHLLLGLLSERKGFAALCLAAQDVDLDGLEAAITDGLPPASEQKLPALIPFDLDARKVLELTVREALRMGHNYVGTEHVLLALLEQEGGAGPLATAGADKATSEAWILEQLAQLTGG
jgi:ATP-dependent Clp protease ATP-binding subunit ClpA